MKQGKTVVFADSVKYVHNRTINALGDFGGINVHFCRNAEELLFTFDDTMSGFLKPDMLVMCCLLPHGSIFSATETNHGARTGFLLYKHLRQRFPELVIYIMVFIDEHRDEFVKIHDPNLLISDGYPRKDDLLTYIQARLRVRLR